jgi:hypothetical protein
MLAPLQSIGHWSLPMIIIDGSILLQYRMYCGSFARHGVFRTDHIGRVVLQS